jgi:glycosyltransferase involved in cell wall biosynthesis
MATVNTSANLRFSVIMTVYDNARELEENLPAYLEQDYVPGYEIIIVDESSADDTDDVLIRIKNQLASANQTYVSRLYTTFLPKPNRQTCRQRMALTLGVKAARNEWVIFSDIHQRPSSTWLSELVEFMTGDTEVVLGYIRKSGDIRLQSFHEIESVRRFVGMTERRRANGHKGGLMRYLRGKYDMVVVRTSQGHNLLRLYERDIHGHQLLGYRLSIFFHNIFH